MNKLLLLCCILLTVTCSRRKIENPTSDFLPGKGIAKLTDDRLKELSGLVASISNPGLLWSHNDSGNGNDFFLLDTLLNVKLVCQLQGVDNRDWEDIAIGPGPEEGKNYLYIADIGDNDAKYPYKHIYRFEEPQMKPEEKMVTISHFDTITFKLSGKKKDTESLLLDPKTKNLYIVSKREEPVHVYEIKYPYSTSDTLTATSVSSLPLTQIVAADISRDGKKVLMKNYEHVYYWNNTNGKTLIDLLKEKPFEVPYESEPQGESIAWTSDGKGFYTISEKNLGKNSYLYFYKAR
jgi:hypothetical protein